LFQNSYLLAWWHKYTWTRWFKGFPLIKNRNYSETTQCCLNQLRQKRLFDEILIKLIKKMNYSTETLFQHHVHSKGLRKNMTFSRNLRNYVTGFPIKSNQLVIRFNPYKMKFSSFKIRFNPIIIKFNPLQNTITYSKMYTTQC